ncbi:DUF2726 domain-containing protein [Pseudoduganella flava]|nr:DUF2726 domain-containing protein [Pseudoduganella flava]
MSALVEPTSSNSKTAHGDRLRVAQQRVDYVVCTKRCEVVAVVELDDKTRTRAEDALRDARLEQGGIRTVGFQARNKPKVEAIRAMILGPVEGKAGTGPGITGHQGISTAVDGPATRS